MLGESSIKHIIMKFAIINDLRDAGWEKQALPSNQDRCLLLMNTS